MTVYARVQKDTNIVCCGFMKNGRPACGIPFGELNENGEVVIDPGYSGHYGVRVLNKYNRVRLQESRESGWFGTWRAERRAVGEVNIVRHHVSRSYGRIVSQNLFTFLNLLIFGVSAVLAVLGLYIDALLAGALGVVNALVAIVQEVRAKRALNRIAVLTRSVATVIRDGHEQTVQIDDIVRDDLVIVRPGDQVAADGPVVSTAGLSMDESLLTGESELVPKTTGDTLYSGSFCITRQAMYRAERIGTESTAEQIDIQARTFR